MVDCISNRAGLQKANGKYSLEDVKRDYDKRDKELMPTAVLWIGIAGNWLLGGGRTRDT